MEIPLQAQVRCTDGVSGKSVYVLIDPVANRITHLVVQADESPHTEYIVPIDLVSQTVDGTLQLRCRKAELEKMEQFVRTTFIEQTVPDYAGYTGYGSGEGYYLPYVAIPDRTVHVPVEDLQIPAGELAVRRGTRVAAADSDDVGHVDEFVINSENSHITHLVMREGHFWDKKDVIIPLAAIDDIQDDVVSLKLDKEEIGALPTFPVQRRWS